MTCEACNLASMCTRDGVIACRSRAYSGLTTPYGTTLQTVSRARIAAERSGRKDVAEALSLAYQRILVRPAPFAAPGADLAAVWKPIAVQPDLFEVAA